MSDGTATIADLKVCVDAETAKFSQGMSVARSTVEQFGTVGASALSLVDAKLVTVGNGVDILKGKLMPWIGVMQAGMGILNSLIGEAEKVAAATGQQDKFNELKGAATELQNTIGTELKKAFDETKDSALSFFSAASSGSAMASAFEKVQNIVGAAIEKTISLTKEFTFFVNSSIPASTRPLEVLARNVRETTAKIEDLEASLAAVQSRAANAPTMAAFVVAEPLAAPVETGDVEQAGILRNIEALKEKAALESEMYRRRLQAASQPKLEIVDPVLSEEFVKLLANMDKEIAALEFKTRTLGMTADAVKRLAQEEAVRAAATEKGIAVGELENQALAERLAKEEAAHRKIQEFGEAKKRDAKAAADAQRADNQFESTIAGLERKAADLDAKARLIAGGNKASLAREIDEEQTLLRLKQQGITVTDQRADRITDALDAEAAAQERLKLAKADVDFDKVLRGGERELYQLASKVNALSQTAYETARLTQEQRLLAQASQQGVTLDEARMAQIRALSVEYAKQTQELKGQETQLRVIGGVGEAVSRGLESAWDKWAKGGKVSFQDMTLSILHDIEKMILKMLILKPLMDSLGQGANSVVNSISGSIGGALGGGASTAGTSGWTTTTSLAIDGARAAGGPVADGKLYLIGEQGPELLRMRGDGDVVPNGGSLILPPPSYGGAGPSSAASPPNITINITAPPGTSAKEVSRYEDSGGGMNMELLIEQMDSSIGQRITEGRSSTGNAMTSTFGLNRAAGAR
jgi:Lambda phage tail tape-measure protein (Tape_meas_lam_C)